MKNLIIPILFTVAALGFFSCEDDSPRVEIKGDVQPMELKATSASSYELTLEAEESTFEKFEWTKPDYGVQVAINYRLQLDVAGNDFADAIDLVNTNSLEASFLVGVINDRLLSLGLEPDEETEVQVRVRSDINPNVDPVYSNVRSFTVIPYATEFPPIYMIGDAVEGWDTGLAVEMRSTGPNVYETITEFNNNGAFRFFSEPSWDADPQYNWTYFEGGTVDENFENAQDGDTNIRFVGSTGFFKITVNVKDKTIEMEAVEKPTLFMIGAALQGWDLGLAVEMTWVKDGVFQATAEFNNNEAFRFFTKADWSTGFGNYPHFEEGDIDPLFENANDGDSNFRFIGTTGEYTITVNLYELTIEMEQ